MNIRTALVCVCVCQCLRDMSQETVITLAVAYLGFFVADSVLKVSGVLATVAAGITLALLGRSSIRGGAAVHQVWETIEHVGYTLIFLLAGNIFGMVLAEPNNGVGLREWGWLLLLWLALLTIRGAVIAAFYPVLDVLGYGLHWKVHNTVRVKSGFFTNEKKQD